MVAEGANTFVSIMRGVSYNALGDLMDSASAVTSGIPAILVETSHTTFDPATQEPRTVRTATLKLAHWVQVDDDDQIRDDMTGGVYAIISVTRPPMLTAMPVGGPPDLLLELRRVTATGT